jgi:hypothetical protein
MLQIGDGDPSAAWVNGGWMFLAIVVGVVVADLVSWITYAERDLSIVEGEGSLLPIRAEPLGRAAQLTVTMLLAQYVFFALDMPGGDEGSAGDDRHVERGEDVMVVQFGQEWRKSDFRTLAGRDDLG